MCGSLSIGPGPMQVILALEVICSYRGGYSNAPRRVGPSLGQVQAPGEAGPPRRPHGTVEAAGSALSDLGAMRLGSRPDGSPLVSPASVSQSRATGGLGSVTLAAVNAGPPKPGCSADDCAWTRGARFSMGPVTLPSGPLVGLSGRDR